MSLIYVPNMELSGNMFVLHMVEQGQAHGLHMSVSHGDINIHVYSGLWVIHVHDA